MNCPRCGVANDASVTFCSRCGQTLAAPIARPRRNWLGYAAMLLALISAPLLGFCGLGAVTGMAAVVCGIAALVQARGTEQDWGEKMPAILGIAAGGLMPVLFAATLAFGIVLPSLLGRRLSPSESAAVSDIRTVIAAQARYAAANHGYNDTLVCLAQPRGCLPGPAGYNVAGMDSTLASAGTRHGYEFVLHLGPAALLANADTISPSSAIGFAYVATPLQPGVTGRDVYCGDATGVVRFSPSGPQAGPLPTVAGAACPALWRRMP